MHHNSFGFSLFVLATRIAQLDYNGTEEEKTRDPYLALTAGYSMACKEAGPKARRTKRITHATIRLSKIGHKHRQYRHKRS